MVFSFFSVVSLCNLTALAFSGGSLSTPLSFSRILLMSQLIVS